MKCFKCNIDEKDQLAMMQCESCARTLHKNCSGLCPSEINGIELKGKRLLKVYCVERMEGLMQVPKLIKAVQDLSEEVSNLKAQMQCATQVDLSAVQMEKMDLCNVLQWPINLPYSWKKWT